MAGAILDCADSYVPAQGMGGTLDATVIVVHSAETPESGTSAEGVANYFASGTTSSTHATTDENSIVQSVPLDRVCFGTGEGGANGWTWQIEQAGTGAQSRDEWLDAYSRATITHTAVVIKEMRARKPAIRGVFLPAEALLAGERYGITSHGEIHRAWPQGDYRSDPGPNYPWDVLLGMVNNDPTPGDVANFYQLLVDLQEAQDMKIRLVTYAGQAGVIYGLIPDPAKPTGHRRQHLNSDQLGALGKAGLIEFDGAFPKVYGPLDATQFTQFA